jgi:predicted kinase
MKSLSLSKPHVIVMVGVPGSGKSYFAEKFAGTFRAPYVSLEKITAYIPENTKAADAIIEYQLDELLKTSQSIIVEGIAETRAARLELTKKARANGYETLLVWVQIDPLTAKNRITRQAKANTGSTYSPEEYERALKRFTAPSAIEKPVVISGKHTYATQAKVILKKLSSPRAAISAHSAAPVRTDQPGRRNITIR